jgi:large repetitive protein
VLANPSNGSGVNVFGPLLSVHNSTDADRDTLTYEFEIYGDAALANLISSETTIQETQAITGWAVTTPLTENSTYYWRARAFDGQLYSPWMQAASFMVNTSTEAPTAPELYQPVEGISLDTLSPTLSVIDAVDPDSDSLTYDFEIYTGTTLVTTLSGISEDPSGITSVVPNSALLDNTTYTWRARAFDGERYGAWMDSATFSIHLSSRKITSTIDFDPDTLSQKSKGNWVTVYIELPAGYNVADIVISSVRLEGTIPAEAWPYSIGDYDHDGIPDLIVKFNRAAAINLLPNGDAVPVKVTGRVGSTTFEGVDSIRVIH